MGLAFLQRFFGKHESTAPVAVRPSEEILPTLAIPDRIKGAIFGTLVGDALGVPYEFHPPRSIPQRHLIEMQPPAKFTRSHAGVPVGTWSDDGAQFLALLESLGHHRGLNLQAFGQELLAWWNEGRYTPDGSVFDIGNQTRNALLRLENGASAFKSGAAEKYDNGNGSLMRTAACAVVPFKSTQDLIARARTQSLVTHGHALSQICCALSAVITALLLRGMASREALTVATRLVREATPASEASVFEELMAGRSMAPQGTGYVLDSFWSAWYAFSSSTNYEDCVRSAISFGNDTDTTACIAGGWAGAAYGYAGIPERWLRQLVKSSVVEEIAEKAVQRAP